MALKYQRILLKISGEALGGEKGMGFDEPTISAGLLHDTVEDTKATIEELDENFGEEVADIVDGVTKISMLTFDSNRQRIGDRPDLQGG